MSVKIGGSLGIHKSEVSLSKMAEFAPASCIPRSNFACRWPS